jgi:chromosome segregation ATPase
MKVNLRRNTMDKEKRPQTSLNSINNISNSSQIDEFRLYINNIETLLRDTLNENVKLRQQLNEFSAKKNQIDIRKLQSKADELVKKYSRGKTYLNELEKKIGSSKQINQLLKDFKNPPSNDLQNSNNNYQNLMAQYESKLEAALEKYNHIENQLNACEKEKDDLKNKFNDEFVLMSSVIYNLGFLYWSMKSDYEDKLKQNKGWLEMERIKQYNGDY